MSESQDFAVQLFCSLRVEGGKDVRIPYAHVGRRWELDRALRTAVDSKGFSSDLTPKFYFAESGECPQLSRLISRACDNGLISNGSLDGIGYEFLVTPEGAGEILRKYGDSSEMRRFAKVMLGELPKKY